MDLAQRIRRNTCVTNNRVMLTIILHDETSRWTFDMPADKPNTGSGNDGTNSTRDAAQQRASGIQVFGLAAEAAHL